MFNDKLGERMKNNYESVSKTRLTRRTPVIIRLDGKAFHTFTKGFEKPFDQVLMKTMMDTMKSLCENIQGCVLGYTQSDEISLLLIDYKTLNTDAWFDYEVQKMVSIAASMATLYFNKYFVDNINLCSNEEQVKIHNLKINKAMFDARAFNIPREEVTNCFFWRQVDAERNSIQMVGQACYSSKKLKGKSCKEIKEMLQAEFDINWDNLPISVQRGTGCIKSGSEWIIDTKIPRFVGEGREYIEKLIKEDE